MSNFLSEYSERLISWQIGGKETGLDRSNLVEQGYGIEDIDFLWCAD